MKLQINITKEILKESMYCTNGDLEISKTGQNCAIGKAIYNLFGNKSWVGAINIIISTKEDVYFICSSISTWINNSDSLYIELPLVAQRFISDFDRLKPEERLKMKPFSFIIDVPDKVIEMISLDEVYKILENSTTMELVS